MKKATSRELYPEEYKVWKEEYPHADESKSQWGTSYLVPTGWFCYSEIVESLKAVEKRIDEPTTSEKERDKLQIERDEWKRRLSSFGEVEKKRNPVIIPRSVIHDSLYCFCQEDLDSEEKKNNIREVKPQPIPVTVK